MPIIIPSKKNYDIKNQKVISNLIDNVSVDTKNISPSNEYDVTVQNQIVAPELSRVGITFNAVAGDIESSFPYADGQVYKVSYLSYTPYYVSDVRIIVPRKNKNSFVSNIYDGKDKDGNFFVKCALNGELSKGTASSRVRYDIGADPQIIQEVDVVYNDKIPHSITISKETENTIYEVKDTSGYDFDVEPLKLDITNAVNQKYPIDLSAKKSFTQNGEYYEFNVSFISSYEMVKMYGWMGDASEEDFEFPIGSNIGAHGYGEAERFIAKSIEISVKGDTIGIELEDGSEQYGYGNHPFSIEGNELTQKDLGVLTDANYSYFKIVGVDALLDGFVTRIEPTIGNFYEGAIIKSAYGNWEAKLYKDQYGNLSLNTISQIGNEGEENIPCYISVNRGKYFSDKIIEEYKNGKETATVLCEISDYYDEGGARVIDINGNKMSFDIGDEVIPMVFSADGVDRPMSRYKGGSAKVFRVCGLKFIYDGAVWQELTLQEV